MRCIIKGVITTVELKVQLFSKYGVYQRVVIITETFCIFFRRNKVWLLFCGIFIRLEVSSSTTLSFETSIYISISTAYS